MKQLSQQLFLLPQHRLEELQHRLRENLERRKKRKRKKKNQKYLKKKQPQDLAHYSDKLIVVSTE